MPLPAVAVRLIVGVLAAMAEGKPVSVIPTEAELTTQQAADMLNVSRPHLVKLLNEGRIPHGKVGTHRRVNVADICPTSGGRSWMAVPPSTRWWPCRRISSWTDASISTFTALFDANVFFGAALRSLVVELSMTGLFRARRTDEIHAEWISAFSEKRHNIGEERLRRVASLD